VNSVSQAPARRFRRLHHAHPLGDAAHQVEVVTDQQQRHAQALLQGFEQQQDLALHGHIQAVVGSSAISNSGSQARAMAIIARAGRRTAGGDKP
jgi:hypothetical protein